MRFISVFLLCFMCLASRVWAEFQGQVPEDLMPDLRDVIAIALRESNDIQERAFLEREAKGRQLSHRAAVMPGFSANFSLRQEEDQGVRKEQGFQERAVYNIRLSQPIYHWGAKISEKQIGDAIYEIEKLNYESVRETIVRSVRKYYMDLVLAKQELAVSRRALELENEDLAFQKEQVEVGAASQASVAGVEMSRDRAQVDYLRRQYEWEKKLEDLSYYVGMSADELEPLIADRIPDIAPLKGDDFSILESKIEDALELNESYQKAKLELEIERKRLRITKVSLKPKINGELGMSSNALDLDGTRREQEYVYFGLSISWSIFDGFKTRGNLLTAVQSVARKELALKELKEKLTRELHYQLRRIELSIGALELEERSLSMSEGRLKRIEEEIEQKRMSQSDFENFEPTHLNNSIRVQRSRIDYLDSVGTFLQQLTVLETN